MPVGYAYAPQRWRAMSAEQKTRANCLALEIQTGNPLFLHVLQQSCLNKKPFAVSLFILFFRSYHVTKYIGLQKETVA